MVVTVYFDPFVDFRFINDFVTYTLVSVVLLKLFWPSSLSVAAIGRSNVSNVILSSNVSEVQIMLSSECQGFEHF